MNVAVMQLINDGKIRSQKDVKSIIYSSMNREDLDVRFCNVIKHSDVAHAEAVLGLAQAPQLLDPTLADFRRLVRQVHLKRLVTPVRMGTERFLSAVAAAGARIISNGTLAEF